MVSHSNVLELIGNTPLVELSRVDTGLCQLLVKLENHNPGGLIKDRIGRSMIEAAEQAGLVGPGRTFVEATAGNTGIGLALVAAQKGYRLTLVIPDKMSQEKVFHLKALGANVVMTRSDVGRGHPDYYQDLAERIARNSPRYLHQPIQQSGQSAGPRNHHRPGDLVQAEHRLDAVVCGVGAQESRNIPYSPGLCRILAHTHPRRPAHNLRSCRPLRSA